MNDKNSKSRSLITLTVLVAIIIVAASWFLLISPTLASASDANAQAADQENTNANTQIEVDKLRQQYANIAEYEADLAALQEQIPTTPGYADLQRMFAALATDNDVVITTLQFGSAQALQATPASPAEADAGDTTEPEPSATPDPEAGSSTGGSSAGVPGLYGIPVSVTVVGRYDDVMSFLKALQTGENRLVLVSEVTLTREDSVDTGSAEITEEAATGVFGGGTFVLTGSTPPAEQPEDTTTEDSDS